MAKNISGYYTQGFYITYPIYDPVDVSGVINAKNAFGLSWYVSKGFYENGPGGRYHQQGPPFYPAAITNTGTIKASLTLDSTGVYIFAGYAASGGSLLNQGLISGDRGVQVYAGRGTITNAGSIVGYVKPGVELLGGGVLSNQSGGSIIGKGTGSAVYATGPVTVSNTGWLGNLTTTGIDLKAGGTLRNFSGGTITSSATKGSAVYLKGAFAVENDGLITGYRGFSVNALSTLNNYGTIVGLTLGAIDLFAGGNVTNQASGTIAAQGTGSALYGAGATASVVNLGIISAISSASSGVNLKAGGMLRNQSGGTIDGGPGAGVLLSAPGSVANDGVIRTGGTHSAVHLAGGGEVYNYADGSITATSANAVYLSAGAQDTLKNSGKIAGGSVSSGVVLLVPGMIGDNALSTLDGGAYGALANSAGDSVTNSGTIQQIGTVFKGGAGVGFGASATSDGLYNAAQGYIQGNDAVLSMGAATSIQNAGTLLGVSVGAYLGVGGQVTNQRTGLVQGAGGSAATSYGIKVAGGAGTVTNMGTLYGRGAGVDLTAGGSVTNQAGGLIRNQIGKSISAATPLLTLSAIALVGTAAATVVNAGGIGAVGVIPTGDLNTDLSGAYGATGIAAYGGPLFLSNQAGGTIAGRYAVSANGGVISLTNDGALLSNAGSANKDLTVNGRGYVNGAGVAALMGLYANNLVNGVISGYRGIAAAGLVKIGNAGTIQSNGMQSPGNRLPAAIYLGGTAPGPFYVSNAASGLITAAYDAILAFGHPTTIVNAGTIITKNAKDQPFGGVGGGVVVGADASVSNQSGGTISGRYGVLDHVADTNVTVTNAGSIAGSYGDSVYIVAGTVINQAGGTVYSPGTSDVYIAPGELVPARLAVAIETYGTVRNAGTILQGGTPKAGVQFGGLSRLRESTGFGVGVDYLTNASTGVIPGVRMSTTGVVVNAGRITKRVDMYQSGAVTNAANGYITGVDFRAGGAFGQVPSTVINAGSIVGDTIGSAIIFNGSGLVINQSGGIIGGNPTDPAKGGAGVLFTGDGTIENDGIILGVGDPAVDFYTTGPNRLIVDPGGAFVASGLPPSSPVVNGGAASVSTLELAAGSGTLNGIGTTIVNFGTVVFDSNASWTLGGVAAGLGGPISGFAMGDTIDLASFVAISKNYANGALSLTDASNGIVSLNIAGTTGDFIVVGDGTGTGTDITLGLACFAAGTRIATSRGPVAVEALTAADQLVTADGAARPVVWIGSRAVNCAAHPDPRAVWPVRIARGAFGPGQPDRDLYLSPDHAVFVNDVLVPVKLLLNDTSITQMPRPRVTYYHVQLPEHTVILAEGLTVESFLDTGDKADFAENETIRLFPGFAPRPSSDVASVWEMSAVAPLVTAGLELANIRRLIAEYAARDTTFEVLTS